MESYIDSRSGSYGALLSVLISPARWMSNTNLAIHDTVCVCSRRTRQRRQLLSLSDRMLTDIGLIPLDVAAISEGAYRREMSRL